MKHRQSALAIEALDAVQPPVADDEVAVRGQRQAIGQRGALGLHVALLEIHRGAVRNSRCQQPLAAVRADAHHATAGVGAPQGAVGLGNDAFRALQVVADELDAGAVDLPAFEGVACHAEVSCWAAGRGADAHGTARGRRGDGRLAQPSGSRGGVESPEEGRRAGGA